jgi:hypothetical protein
MGELSKRIGEHGENLVENYFRLIGWADAQKKFDIRCVKPEKHASSGSRGRQTHGVDFLFSYSSPLTDGVLNNLVISVKFSNDEYPSNPSTMFREHFKELAETVECFKKSSDRQSLQSGKQGIRKVQDIGVLFWLSNSDNTYNDLITKVSSAYIPDDYAFDAIYIVDNSRMAFVYDAIQFAKREYPNDEIDYFYFETGRNINPIARHHTGSILPVEYVNTSVLPLRIALKGTESKVLMLFSIDPFNEANLKRLIGMTKNLSGGWAQKIALCFSDYKPIEHENIVQRAKMSFEDQKTTKDLFVVSYASDFRNLK